MVAGATQEDPPTIASLRLGAQNYRTTQISPYCKHHAPAETLRPAPGLRGGVLGAVGMPKPPRPDGSKCAVGAGRTQVVPVARVASVAGYIRCINTIALSTCRTMKRCDDTCYNDV